jgi:hypothetical protein
MNNYYEAIIIGGGMAGAYLAHHMHHQDIDFCLLEVSYKLGGRHQTIKKDCNVLYEAGAWRVHSSHKRLIKLCKQLDLHLDFLEKQEKRPFSLKGIAGLSKLDQVILEKEGDIKKALITELELGYQGSLEADSTSHPYRSKTEEGEYYTISEGQEALITRLVRDISKKRIKTHHRVLDFQPFEGGYQVKVACDNDKDDIKEKIFNCKYLFSCIAQFDAWAWTPVQEYLYPLLNAVFPHALHHIYARGKGNFRGKRRMTNKVVEQIVPPTHDKKWFQISYSAGRAAEFWNRYKLKYGLAKMKTLLEDYTGFELEEIASYHWTYGYHMWQPVPQFDIKKAVTYSIEPQPNKLPHFYWSGECFSSYQGWSEGALETSDMVLDCWHNKKHLVPLYKNIPTKYKEIMIFDGRILDVRKWKEVHPGSKELIEKHLGEDISKRFRFIKHSDLSWAALYSLQIGYLK